MELPAFEKTMLYLLSPAGSGYVDRGDDVLPAIAGIDAVCEGAPYSAIVASDRLHSEMSAVALGISI